MRMFFYRREEIFFCGKRKKLSQFYEDDGYWLLERFIQSVSNNLSLKKPPQHCLQYFWKALYIVWKIQLFCLHCFSLFHDLCLFTEQSVEIAFLTLNHPLLARLLLSLPHVPCMRITHLRISFARPMYANYSCQTEKSFLILSSF